MNDPRRLIEGSDGPLLARLLSAGRLEEPSPELVERFARTAALSVAAGVVITSGASTSASAASASASAALGVGQAAPLAPALASGVGPSALGAAAAVEAGVAASGAAASAAAASGAAASGAAASGVAALLKAGATSTVLVKWLGVGVVGLTAAVSTPQVLHWVEQREPSVQTAPPRPATSVRAASSARPDAPSATASSGAPRDVAPEAAAAAAPAEAAPAPALAAAPPAPKAATRSRSASATPSPSRPSRPLRAPPASSEAAAAPPSPRRTLGAELASVDRARVALAQGDALHALTELDGYERAFPARQLALEVTMLRMEAHVQRGDLTRARDLAKRIVAAPVSPLHVRRAREVLEASSSSP